MPSAKSTGDPSPEVQDELVMQNGATIPLENGGTNGEVNRDHFEALPDNCVFIAGGGPVGMTTATVLAFYGIKSVVLERNKTTTKYALIFILHHIYRPNLYARRWPKMDLTNVRSMEFFRKLGLAEELRKRGKDRHLLLEENCDTEATTRCSISHPLHSAHV